MVWGGISASQKNHLSLITTTINRPKLIGVLEDYLRQYVYCVHDDSFLFMQNNSGVHQSNIVQEWLADTNIAKFDWPFTSPDLYPIENIWGVLARMT